jgi:hypothetical protein
VTGSSDGCQFEPLAVGGELIISQRYAARPKQQEIYLESFRGSISIGAAKADNKQMDKKTIGTLAISNQ